MPTVEEIREQLEKDYGIARFAEAPAIRGISSGSFALDRILGNGGFPRGRVTVLAGPDGSGKTTVSLHTAANAQRANLNVAYIDAEHKLDLRYAEKLGVDITNWMFWQPEHGEEAMAIADTLCTATDLGLIILDSAAALGSKREKEVEYMDDADMMKVPRMLNKFFRRRIHDIRQNEIALIITNQLRDLIGSYWGGTTTPGGRGLKHYRSIVLNLWPGKKIKDGEQIVGHIIKATTEKNNVYKGYRTTQFDIFEGMGIDYVADVFNTAIEDEVIVRRGSIYQFDGETIEKGKLKTIEELRANTELLEMIKMEILNG